MLGPPLLLVVAAWCAAFSEPELPRAKADETERSRDARTLAAAGLAADGPALLRFFHARTSAENDGEQLRLLVEQLSDPSADVRSRAVSALVARGPVAIPALRHAVNDLADRSRAERARLCLQGIEGAGGAAIVAAAARLLAVHKPEGAAEVLLAYVPFADDESVTAAVREALAVLAYANRMSHLVLMRAVRDPLPVRRAVAAEALCRRSCPEHWPTLRGLLGDPNKAVRIRAALALAKVEDADSIPVLIDMLDEMPAAQRAAANDLLTELAGEWAPLPSGDGKVERSAWTSWWRTIDGPALLAEFRKHTLTAEKEARIRERIERLGDKSFVVRDRATKELQNSGTVAVPLLREALKDSDLERRLRVEDCLRKIGRSANRSLPRAAPRLLALRKPPGATEVLLAYLPGADDDALKEEIAAALAILAARDRAQRAHLVRTLKDPHPARRAAAAVALTKAGLADSRPAVRQLLADEHPGVRVGVAVALTMAGERDAVNVLLDALTGAPLDPAHKAHETLYMLADDKAPATTFGTDAASRKQCRAAWTRWWHDNAASVDFSNLAAPRLLGYTLIVEAANDGTGRVLELGRDGKVRWRIDNLQGPADAHLLGGSRVLIAEAKGMRVTERNLKGEIVWQVQGLKSSPINVQRLANGRTFIGTEQGILVVDRAGKELLRRDFDAASVFGAAQVRNGDIYCFLAGGTCLRLNSAAKEIKSFPSGRASFDRGGIDVLPNGRILITQPNQNAVVEVDGDGTSYRRIEVPGVTAASWTPDGHILAACFEERKVLELDSTGRLLWTYSEGLHPSRARRR